MVERPPLQNMAYGIIHMSSIRERATRDCTKNFAWTDPPDQSTG